MTTIGSAVPPDREALRKFWTDQGATRTADQAAATARLDDVQQRIDERRSRLLREPSTWLNPFSSNTTIVADAGKSLIYSMVGAGALYGASRIAGGGLRTGLHVASVVSGVAAGVSLLAMIAAPDDAGSLSRDPALTAAAREAHADIARAERERRATDIVLDRLDDIAGGVDWALEGWDHNRDGAIDLRAGQPAGRDERYRSESRTIAYALRPADADANQLVTRAELDQYGAVGVYEDHATNDYQTASLRIRSSMTQKIGAGGL